MQFLVDKINSYLQLLVSRQSTTDHHLINDSVLNVILS